MSVADEGRVTHYGSSATELAFRVSNVTHTLQTFLIELREWSRLELLILPKDYIRYVTPRVDFLQHLGIVVI